MDENSFPLASSKFSPSTTLRVTVQSSECQVMKIVVAGSFRRRVWSGRKGYREPKFKVHRFPATKYSCSAAVFRVSWALPAKWIMASIFFLPRVWSLSQEMYSV